MAAAHRLLAVDWGTSSLRGALLDTDGQVLEERAVERGILTVPAGAFASVLRAHFDDWLGAPGTICLISGMAGSRQGWVEAPYCACPAGFDEVAAQLAWIEPGRIAIVPGLRCAHDGVPDVMRGEEVQIFGAMALLGTDEGTFVLPGTHSKWATVRGGRVTAFRTCMTGEFYALLSTQSILARTMDAAAPLDRPAFIDGVRRSLCDPAPGLLHLAFSARTLALFERMRATELPSYLSGLLIGDELRVQPAETVVTLIGNAALTERYALALAERGLRIVGRFGAEATWAGLHALAGRLSSNTTTWKVKL